jgi:hypothetical protein
MSRLQPRVRRLETATPDTPTHEESLFALERLENPPPGYTDADRERDEDILRRWNVVAIEAGLGR